MASLHMRDESIRCAITIMSREAIYYSVQPPLRAYVGKPFIIPYSPVLLARHLRLHRTHRWSDPDRLDIDEFANAERRKLASVPTMFNPTKGQAGIGGGHAIYKDCATLDTPCQLACQVNVAGP